MIAGIIQVDLSIKICAGSSTHSRRSGAGKTQGQPLAFRKRYLSYECPHLHLPYEEYFGLVMVTAISHDFRRYKRLRRTSSQETWQYPAMGPCTIFFFPSVDHTIVLLKVIVSAVTYTAPPPVSEGPAQNIPEIKAFLRRIAENARQHTDPKRPYIHTGTPCASFRLRPYAVCGNAITLTQAAPKSLSFSFSSAQT